MRWLYWNVASMCILPKLYIEISRAAVHDLPLYCRIKYENVWHKIYRNKSIIDNKTIFLFSLVNFAKYARFKKIKANLHRMWKGQKLERNALKNTDCTNQWPHGNHQIQRFEKGMEIITVKPLNICLCQPCFLPHRWAKWTKAAFFVAFRIYHRKGAITHEDDSRKRQRCRNSYHRKWGERAVMLSLSLQLSMWWKQSAITFNC